MTEAELMNAQVQAKRMYNALSETMDLTRQLAEAVDRDDQVTIQMLVTMREEPVKVLRQTQQALTEQRRTLEAEAGQRLAQLINGEAAMSPEEEPLVKQIGANRRLLQQLQELDKILNRKLAREKSLFREESHR